MNNSDIVEFVDEVGNVKQLRRSIVQAQERAVFAALQQEVSPESVRQIANTALNATSQAIQEVQQQHRVRLACHKGCCWCCYLPVPISAPELFLIIHYAQDNFTPENFDALKKQAAKTAEYVRSQNWRENEFIKTPCPLLVNRKCSIYEVRPLTCRGYNSVSELRCRAKWENPSGDLTIPLFSLQRTCSDSTTTGLAMGLANSGLENNLLFLPIALHIALETPDVEERWLSGEPVFAEAIFNPTV